MISQRIKKVKPSATLEITAKAKALREKGENVISLGAGEPDFDTPKHIKEALYEALKEGFIYYTPTAGILELREAISEKLKRDNNIEYDPADEIIVTPGAKQALYEAITATIDPGDEVLIPDPWWVSYVPMVQLAEGKPVFVPTFEENEFRLNPEDIKDKISSKTKALIINSPNNPTGAVLDKRDLKAISEICIDHNILVISDEIYEHIIYDAKHYSIASFEMKDQTITVNGFSKAYSMTGWRLGYAAGPKEIIKVMTRLQAHSVSHPTSFVQKAGVAALRGPQECVKEMRDSFKERRNMIIEMLKEIEGVSCVIPKGAFYVFPNFSNYEKDSFKLATFILEKAKVALVPGGAFGEHGEGFLRLSYATSIENIREGVSRIKEVVEGYG